MCIENPSPLQEKNWGRLAFKASLLSKIKGGVLSEKEGWNNFGMIRVISKGDDKRAMKVYYRQFSIPLIQIWAYVFPESVPSCVCEKVITTLLALLNGKGQKLTFALLG